MNKNIKRATWENTIEEYNFKKDNTNNIIVGVTAGIMVAICTFIYVVMVMIYG